MIRQLTRKFTKRQTSVEDHGDEALPGKALNEEVQETLNLCTRFLTGAYKYLQIAFAK